MKKSFLIFSLSSLLFSLGWTFAYTSTDLSHANSLAERGVIVKQAVATDYNLNSKILRQEVIAMALKVKGVTLPENYQCKKYFADTTQNNWECMAVELAADNGIMTRENRNANPEKFVTRSEALAMLLSASNLELSPWAGYSYYYDTNLFKDGGVGYKNAYNFWAPWQAQVFYQYIRAVLHDDTALRQDPRVNDYATRAEVFKFTINIVDSQPMNITIYITDPALSPSKDCWATQPMVITVPRTKAVADAGLRYLFKHYKPALSSYYQWVTITNGVASIKFSGAALKYLNSPACEQMSYKWPIEDTLTQYPTVTSVQYIIDGEVFDAWDA